MEYGQFAKNVIDFQKMSFDNWYSTLSMMQDQAVSSMDMMLNQATWIPEEGLQAIQNWVTIFQDERDRFKAYMDKGFTVMEKAFSETRKSTDKTKKAAS